ncbi:MAG: hypothetical protein DMF79_19620, partial [Acidobacteria bacterium]
MPGGGPRPSSRSTSLLDLDGAGEPAVVYGQLRRIRPSFPPVPPRGDMARSSTRSTRRSRAGARGPRGGLRASERRFRALIENSAEGIALFGVDGTILYGSPATTRILGYGLDEFVGRNAFEMIRGEDHSRVRERLEEALRSPGVAVEV